MAMDALKTIFCLFTVLVLSSSEALVAGNDAHGDNRLKSKTRVFSLFDLGIKNKFWNEKVLLEGFDDLERPDPKSTKAAITNYTMAASVADYLKLEPVESIYLPIPINFIFIGFEGKGNQGVKLGKEELERWFKQIDHVLEHTRVPQVGETLTPFYRQRAVGEQRHHLPFISHVHYNYSVHAIEMSEKVTEVFEYALKVLSRKEDFKDARSDTDIQWQIDLDSISYIFSSLVHYLQLENAYNIFVLNPKRDPNRVHYGYRNGLSEAEIQFLKEDNKARLAIIKSKPEKYSNPLDIERKRSPLYQQHPLVRFAWSTLEKADMDHWVDACFDALKTIEKASHAMTDSEIIIAKAQEVFHKGDSDMASALHRELNREENAGLHSDCLVDTWVGRERWAFVDLSAGPFSWGPAVGGVGIRMENTLPSVDDLLETHTGASEDAAHEDLSNLVQERFTMFEEESPQMIDTLLAEIDIYELFSQRHCEGKRAKVVLCEELQERMQDLQEELQFLQQEHTEESHKRKAEEALKRIERWNLFSDVHDIQHIGNFSIARDWFLANLAATLWSSMKHVVTPSTADGSFHFYEKLDFQIYVITQEKIKHKDLLPLEVSLFKEALAGVIAPNQKAQYSTRMLALSEDIALAMAFSVARRAAVVPVLLVNGTHKTTTRLYLDSLILQHQLQHFSRSGSVNGHERSTLEVPIFWFVQQGEPLFIDKHYVAKALPDMVVVVQSTHPAWPSHLQCNRKPILWDLSRPLKDAISATAEHIAGILPSQFTYSEAHSNGDQDWRWAVGSHPFSNMASGWRVSLFQTDAIMRSYIVSTIDESIETMNEAIKKLAKESTSKASFDHFRRQEHILVSSYNTVINQWKQIAESMEGLHYANAMLALHSIEDAAIRFMKATNATIAELHPIQCTRQRKLAVGNEMYAGISMIMSVIIIMLLWLRPRQSKPKVN